MIAKRSPRVVVLAGGTSAEREVSLGSGMASAVALARSFDVRFVEVRADELPRCINAQQEVVFSTLHGVFGEDGGMQRLLSQAGIEFAGCDAKSSELTFDKVKTKAVVKAVGVEGARAMNFEGEQKPTVDQIVEELGASIVFKPNRSGSSVGLSLCANRTEVAESWAKIETGAWLVEERIMGRELTVGVIDRRALPVVEIVPKSGIFDYRSKYTKGLTDYLAPAPLPEKLAKRVQELAVKSYAACGCRDYARIDFMMTEKNELIFLEINTLPGMKETSLLPMGANCMGIGFTALVKALVSPACDRFFGTSAATF